jgi:hypothetical protein
VNRVSPYFSGLNGEGAGGSFSVSRALQSGSRATGSVTIQGAEQSRPLAGGGGGTFAQKARICFGSVDFAVDKNGQWWFLEINEQGQFLWLDQFNPQAKTLEKFCAFITAPEGSARPLEEREGLFPPFSDYIRVYRSLPENQEPVDIAAAVAASPYMSRETGRTG